MNANQNALLDRMKAFDLPPPESLYTVWWWFLHISGVDVCITHTTAYKDYDTDVGKYGDYFINKIPARHTPDGNLFTNSAEQFKIQLFKAMLKGAK